MVFLIRAAVVVVKLACACVSPKACQRHAYPPQFVISRDWGGLWWPRIPYGINVPSRLSSAPTPLEVMASEGRRHTRGPSVPVCSELCLASP